MPRVPAGSPDDRDELARERGLAGADPTVDTDPERVPDVPSHEPLGHLLQHLGPRRHGPILPPRRPHHRR
ncbi:MAG: hypothetical protein PGN07_07135 [Aeromicrobium erythreum]